MNHPPTHLFYFLRRPFRVINWKLPSLITSLLGRVPWLLCGATFLIVRTVWDHASFDGRTLDALFELVDPLTTAAFLDEVSWDLELLWGIELNSNFSGLSWMTGDHGNISENSKQKPCRTPHWAHVYSPNPTDQQTVQSAQFHEMSSEMVLRLSLRLGTMGSSLSFWLQSLCVLISS